MEHSFTNPDPLLNFLITNYLFLRSGSVTEKFIPDGNAAIVFNFQGKVFANDRGKRFDLPPYFLVMPLDRSLTIDVIVAPESMIVRLKTSVFTRIAGIQSEQLAQQPFLPIDSFVPPSVFEVLKNAGTDKERIKIFENFMMSKIELPYVVDEIDELFLKILNGSGVDHINFLINEFQLSPRSFRRKFISRVGVSAKVLSRIVRINNLWSCYLENNDADFQNMVYEGNYYDQSHLIRDFKKIIGEPPSFFFKRDQDKVRFVSGK